MPFYRGKRNTDSLFSLGSTSPQRTIFCTGFLGYKMIRSSIALIVWLFAVTASDAQEPALLLFGDSDHKTFLGCLNCSKYDSGSICNAYSANGSRYNADSIWNPYSQFGSKYSSDSPWNRYTSSGPVIVDKEGGFYGRFTANKHVSDRTRIQVLDQLADMVADGTELDDARKAFCGE
jgi:hypothetical protein